MHVVDDELKFYVVRESPVVGYIAGTAKKGKAIPETGRGARRVVRCRGSHIF
jgi:hypothetical protein